MEELQNTAEWIQANTNPTSSEVVMENTENKSNPMDVIIKAFGEMLLENEDFNYNIVRSAAERMTDDFDIDDHLDMDDLAEKVSYSMSVSDLAESVLDEIDMRDLADNVLENIDYSDFASDLTGYIDFEHEIDRHIDIPDKAYDLLSDYNPTNTCSLGDQFTQAIARAMSYILDNREVQEYKDVQALVKIHSIAAELNQEVNTNLIEESSPDVSQVTYASMQTYSGRYGVDLSSESNSSDSELTDSENFVPSQVPEKTVQDHAIEALKRVVHEVLASYVPGYDSDPFMKIRLETKVFDTFTYWMDGKW